MIQTGLIPNAHSDLVTDASYDYYGLHLATCSLDQRIKIWRLEEENGNWTVEDDWKAHDAAVSKVCWAHPEFGSIIASASFDRTVKVWEQVVAAPNPVLSSDPAVPDGMDQPQLAGSRWVERAVLVEARGTVRAVEFAPNYFGLKLATISTDNFLRIYECLEQPNLTTWQLAEEIDVLSVAPSPAFLSRTQTVALATPTQTNATLDAESAAAGTSTLVTGTLVAQALQAGLQGQQGTRQSVNREADGGWCLSWCKDRYWGEVLAVGCGVSGTIKIVQLSPSRRPSTILVLDPNPAASIPENTSSTTGPGGLTVPPGASGLTSSLLAHPTGLQGPSFVPSAIPTSASSTSLSGIPPTPTKSKAPHPKSAAATNPASSSGPSESQPMRYAITSVSWAPSCGRSYHLVATGGRDGLVRVWKLKPGNEDERDRDDDMLPGPGGETAAEETEEDNWTGSIVAEFDQHKSSVGRVEFNVTGTTLSSAGNDGRIRLWKATSGGNIWRPAGSIGVEMNEDERRNGSGDIHMS